MDKVAESLLDLGQFLAIEGGWINEVAETQAAKGLNEARAVLLQHLHDVGNSGNLELIVATEKIIVQGDLEHYANSKNMESSLRAALSELEAIQRLLAIIDDKSRYIHVDESYSLSRNREKGLPVDEARQAFKSHYARLNNMDKTRLSDDEKSIIDARRNNVFRASKLYAQHQTKTLT
jgi:cell division septal protein FtsQ